MGSKVCRHTHGELGIAATAFHHACLTIPNLVLGNQQTAAHMEGDILLKEIPTATSPKWGLPEGSGLGSDIDDEALSEAKKRFESEGQYLPYGKSSIELRLGNVSLTILPEFGGRIASVKIDGCAE